MRNTIERVSKQQCSYLSNASAIFFFPSGLSILLMRVTVYSESNLEDEILNRQIVVTPSIAAI
jgi:hypothetical protein